MSATSAYAPVASATRCWRWPPRVEDVVPICAVGDDAAGRAFTEALAAAGCRVDGIVDAGRPEPDGGAARTTRTVHTACVFDPGVDWTDLTPRQRQLVAAADVVVAMVGPAPVIRATLAGSRPGATVAWIVKNDPAALLPDVVAALRRRADIIFHNAAESSVVEGVPAESKTIVVRTDGPRPVTVTTQWGAPHLPHRAARRRCATRPVPATRSPVATWRRGSTPPTRRAVSLREPPQRAGGWRRHRDRRGTSRSTPARRPPCWWVTGDGC